MMHKLKYTVPQMAHQLGCSSQLIYKRLYAMGLKQRDRYTDLADSELDSKVAELQKNYPQSGSVVSFSWVSENVMQVNYGSIYNYMYNITFVLLPSDPPRVQTSTLKLS